MIQLSVVVPIYNEIESIPLLAEKLHQSLSRLKMTYEVVLVDDGSTDGSWDKLIEQSQRFPHFKLIRFRRNFGQTAAMSAGFRESIGDIVVTLDADLQNDPDDIPLLLEKMTDSVDVVSGWRKDRKDTFINRRLPSILANGLISHITGVHLHDYGCTLKAYRREVIKNVHLYGEMHRFIPALASWVGGQVVEVPVQHHSRQFGKTKYGITRTVRVVLDLMTVKFLLRYSTGPIQIFGKIGLFFLIPGAFMIFGMIIANLALDSMLIKRPFWIMTAFMLIFSGIQFISMGLLAEIQIRTYHESQDKPIYVIRDRVKSPEPT
jgi:glycosyltransferase involved in cell wall biosynthesis